MPLSDRILPIQRTLLSDHPWVIEEVKKMEAELAELRAKVSASNNPLNSRRFFIATKVAKNSWVGGEEFPSLEAVRNRIRLLHDGNENLKEDDFIPLEITTVYHDPKPVSRLST